MSQKPAASGPESSSISNGSHTSHPSMETQRLPPISNGPSLPSPRLGEHGRPAMAETSGFAAPSRPSSAAHSTSEAEQAASRPLKMHNILNPSSIAREQNRPRPISQAETPPTMSASSSRYPSESSPESLNRAVTPGATLPPINMYSSAPGGHGNSLMLTPSLLSNRGISPRRVNLPSATIDAKASPFLPGGSHVYNPAPSPASHSGHPMGTTPPIVARSSYGFPTQTPNSLDRRASEAISQAPPSQSNSPSTSYSSYSQPSHASPAVKFSTPTTQPPTSRFYGSLGSGGGGISGGPQITLGSDSSYGPVTSSTGQSTYQLMTLDTDQGPIQVPVDVQAASKMADEKRKRNAGASARFRQRRKEKEKEASQTIAKLESQIRDIGEERDYYRAERDYFRSLVYSTSAQSLVVPRLPSPRQRKAPQVSSTGARVESQWEQSEERGGQTGRNTRRRISGAYTPTYELPPPALGPQTQSSGYSAQNFPFPKPEPRAQTPSHRLPLPSGPPRAASFESSAPPIYERAWTSGQ
ncbi:hypothetical protein MMC30_001108 [Trapelia coarctata]|nr:hypothetical protein [Trapelia coarctata]